MILYILRIEVIILDYVISFFRDVLVGPLYTGVAIICGILICACIGCIGEQYLQKKKEKEEFDSTHVAVSSDSNIPPTQM